MTLSLPGFRLAFSLSAPVPFPYGLVPKTLTAWCRKAQSGAENVLFFSRKRAAARLPQRA